MNHNESDQLLAMAQGIWPKMPVRTYTAEAWAESLAHIRYDHARQALLDIGRHREEPPSIAVLCATARHYASLDEITERAKAEPAKAGAIKCSRKSCGCTHTDGCAGGWIDDANGTARPCPMCKPELVGALSGVPDKGAAIAAWREAGGRGVKWTGAS